MKPDKLEETITDLRIGQARQAEQIDTLDKKVDSIASDVKDIHESILDDTKAQNTRLKKYLSRALFILLGSGATVGGINALLEVLK